MRFFMPDLTHYTCFYFLFTDPEKKNKIQTRELLPLCIFTWCQMHQFFDFYYLPTLFTVLKIYNVILCQLFFQQTGAVKTLPQHNPLILSFFLQIPMNSQFDLFTLTEFLFLPVAIRRSTNNIFTLQFELINTLLLLL